MDEDNVRLFSLHNELRDELRMAVYEQKELNKKLEQEIEYLKYQNKLFPIVFGMLNESEIRFDKLVYIKSATVQVEDNNICAVIEMDTVISLEMEEGANKEYIGEDGYYYTRFHGHRSLHELEQKIMRVAFTQVAGV